ncbi:MAG: sigma 54-interacting transcriptional regulator, partial [Ectothiorhodospiraceae bacterium]
MNTKTEATITTPGSFDDADQEALVLSEAAQLLNRATEPESSITAVLRLLSQLVGLNRGRVVLPRSSDGHLAIHYAYGLRAEEKERGVYAPGEGITGQVMATGRVCVVQDIDSESDFLFRAVDRATLPPETVCFIAVPILRDNEPVGVLGFHRLRNRPRAFQADIRLLRIIAAMIGQTLRIDELIRQRTQHLEDQNRALRSALERQTTRHGIVGESRAIREALDQATQVAGSDATVMLSGESGTGKEKFARLIHSHSARASAPFVCINCAAIPEQLLEAEIFGNERGAFTGAVRSRSGKAEAAHGGTLFLDEIGDMSQDLQVKLLRLLQERTVQRVGGDRDIHVDIRVITATHKDLQEAVNQGTFRLDLY